MAGSRFCCLADLLHLNAAGFRSVGSIGVGRLRSGVRGSRPLVGDLKGLTWREGRCKSGGMEAAGVDSTGRPFKNAEEMWREEIGDAAKGIEDGKDWYRKGIEYWEGIEASVEGVLGGYGCLNGIDVKGSDAFLGTLLEERFGAENRRLVALDCGSGIGRVTKNLLLRHFAEVDLLEPVSHFIDAARESLTEGGTTDDGHKATNFFCTPLQEFTPEKGRYDVIWIQWCIGHLTDADFISFFKRAKSGLKPKGFFVVKENIAKSGFVLDKDDNSVTRSDFYFKQLFNKSGLHLLKTKDQKGMPGELFPVKMYALSTEKAGQRKP
ncbi:alpha amino-terminal protein methyltransferase [Wolffia australiana]